MPMKWYTANKVNQLCIIDMSQGFSTVLVAPEAQRIIAQIGRYLTAKNMTVSCAESCTGGGLAFAFTSVDGSSAWFNQSFVTYSNQAKNTLLGVSEKTLLNHGAVSAQCVAEMARGTAAATGADCAISISGIAGPHGGSAEKPVGTVWFGFVLDKRVYTVHQQFSGERGTVRDSAAAFALNYLYNWLVETFGEDL